jgi:hypothetical protein
LRKIGRWGGPKNKVKPKKLVVDLKELRAKEDLEWPSAEKKKKGGGFSNAGGGGFRKGRKRGLRRG